MARRDQKVDPQRGERHFFFFGNRLFFFSNQTFFFWEPGIFDPHIMEGSVLGMGMLTLGGTYWEISPNIFSKLFGK